MSHKNHLLSELVSSLAAVIWTAPSLVSNALVLDIAKSDVVVRGVCRKVAWSARGVSRQFEFVAPVMRGVFVAVVKSNY